MTTQRNKTGGGPGTNGHAVRGTSTARHGAAPVPPARSAALLTQANALAGLAGHPLPADEAGWSPHMREFLDDREGDIYAASERLLGPDIEDEDETGMGWARAGSAALALRTQVPPSERRDRALLRWALANADEQDRPVYALAEDFLGESPEDGGPSATWRAGGGRHDFETVLAFGAFAQQHGAQTEVWAVTERGRTDNRRLVLAARICDEADWTVLDWAARDIDAGADFPEVESAERYRRRYSVRSTRGLDDVAAAARSASER